MRKEENPHHLAPPPTSPTRKAIPRVCTLLVHFVRTCSNFRSFSAAIAIGSIDEVDRGLAQLLSVVSSAASLPATLMLLWLVLPRSGTETVGSLSDFALVEIMLFSQAVGVAVEISIVAMAALRCAAIAALQAARSVAVVAPPPPQPPRMTGENVANAAGPHLTAAPPHTRASLTCTAPIAAIKRCIVVWSAIVGRVCATRFFTWVNGIACGSALAALNYARLGNSEAAQVGLICTAITLWGFVATLASLSVGAFLVGNRTRIRAIIASNALESMSDTAAAVRRRRSIEMAGWSDGADSALNSTSAFRALNLASRGGNVNEGASTNTTTGTSTTTTSQTEENSHSSAVRRFESSRIATLRAESGFFFTVALVSGLLATISWFIVDGVMRLSVPLSSGRPFNEILSQLQSLAQPVTKALINSPSTIVLCWWLGWHIVAMASLVLLARALQCAWDADDALAHSAIVGTRSQALALAAAGEAYAAGTGTCVPLTLERIADGVYKRTTEDAAGRRLGLQLLSNPLHDLLNARRAWSREQARVSGTTPQISTSTGARSLLLAAGSSSARGTTRAPSVVDALMAHSPQANSPSNSSSNGGATSSLILRSVTPSASAETMPGSMDSGGHHSATAASASEAGGKLALVLASELKLITGTSASDIPRLRFADHTGITSTSSTAREMTPHAAKPRDTCFVCFERSGDGIFMECGHAGTCMQCAETIVYGRTKRRIMTREALMTLASTGAQIRLVRPLAEEDAAALLTDRGVVGIDFVDHSVDNTPIGSPISPVNTPTPPQRLASSTTNENARPARALLQRPVTGRAQAILIIEGRGRVPWLDNVQLTNTALDGLTTALELMRIGTFEDPQMRLQVSAAIRASLRDSAAVQSRRTVPPAAALAARGALPPSIANLPPGEPNDKFLVSVEMGGSGVCPVCRAPVSSLLRLGPDVRTTDGRIVALVLPQNVYWAQPAVEEEDNM